MRDFLNFEKMLNEVEEISNRMIESVPDDRYHPATVYLSAALVRLTFKEILRQEIGSQVEKEEGETFDQFMAGLDNEVDESYKRFRLNWRKLK